MEVNGIDRAESGQQEETERNDGDEEGLRVVVGQKEGGRCMREG